MSPTLSNLGSFISGIFIGAGGKYLADQFTDQRRAKAERRKRQEQFAQVEALMPGLIAEMHNDVLSDLSGTKREFYPYASEAICGTPPDKFYYDPEKHPDLTSQIGVLLNHAYIIDVAVSSTPRYRMTEDFVALLREKKPGSTK